MADALTIPTAVAALVDAATRSSFICRSIVITHGNAPQTLSDINAECTLIKSALSFVYSTLSLKHDSLASRLSSGSSLAANFDVVLTAFTVALVEYDALLQRLALSQSKEGWLSEASGHKLGHCWDENAMQGLLQRMRTFRDAVAALLMAVQMDDSNNPRSSPGTSMKTTNKASESPIAGSQSSRETPVLSIALSIFSSGKNLAATEEAITRTNTWQGVLKSLTMPDNISYTESEDDVPSTPSLASDYGRSSSEAPSVAAGPGTPFQVGEAVADVTVNYPWSDLPIPGISASAPEAEKEAPKPKSQPEHFVLLPKPRIAIPPLPPMSTIDSVIKRRPVPVTFTPVAPQLYGNRSTSTIQLEATSTRPTTPVTRSFSRPTPRPILKSHSTSLSLSATQTTAPLSPLSQITIQTSQSSIPSPPTTSTPPLYTFSTDNPSAPAPPQSWLRRQISARQQFRLEDAAQAQAPADEACYIKWLSPSPLHTFPSLNRSPTNARGAVHPAFATTPLTIPILSDSTIDARAAVKRWMSTKPTSSRKTSYGINDTMTIEGVVSDGASTRAVSTTFVCCTEVRGLQAILKDSGASDGEVGSGTLPLAVLCFKATEPGSLQGVVKKWLPLLRNNTLTADTPIVLLALTSGAGPARLLLSAQRKAPEARNRDQDPFLNSLIPKRVIVGRETGEEIARNMGAVGYFECSEENVAGLERLWGVVTGYAVARTLNEGNEGLGGGVGDEEDDVVDEGFGIGVAL